MPDAHLMDAERIRQDFDEIARLADGHGYDTDHHDSFLLSLVPQEAGSVLDMGCGLGRLTATLANGTREVVGVDLSPEMIARARQNAGDRRHIEFVCRDVQSQDFGLRRFDCVLSAAFLHHIPGDAAVVHMIELLRPGGRLIVHDLRADNGVLDRARSHSALACAAFSRFVRTGRPRGPRALREAWLRHGARETYLTLADAHALANRLLPGARVYNHWLWRYTIVWTKPVA